MDTLTSDVSDMIQNKPKFEQEQLLKPSEVAKILHVSPVTIRHWSLDNKLKHITTAGGHRRYRLQDIEQFSADYEKTEISHETTILIVDDDQQHARLLVDFFEDFSSDLVIAVAYDGFKAADLLHRIKPSIVMLDLMMPGMDGFDVCHHIKQQDDSKDITVIAMTGYPSKENIERILQVGAETCFSKPIDLEELRLLVTRLVNINIRYKS